ncbi:porin [Thiomicrorhabdus sp.]|uniref:porin n=1 Tax=Thiomicrorhabdus sp. TaxID=2039724 RepID=UPI0029C61775|nr:porin [Thiomicrorhabdus sp.]
MKRITPFVNTTLKASAAAVLMASSSAAFALTDKERIELLEQKVEALMQVIEQQQSGQVISQPAMPAATSQPEHHLTASETSTPAPVHSSSHAASGYGVHFGGYGEMHANFINGDDEEKRGLDFHRLVLFMGYDFSPSARFVSELEVEHAVSSASKAGEVEVEQAYLEFDLAQDKSMQLRTGILLTPVGIINETHEPATFYGVERPIVETTILPSTWWGGGAMFSQRFNNGISYDFFVSEGLKTKETDPFNLKGGKQKTTSTAGQGGKADIFDIATTARIKYTGIAGLELSAYAQYQPDLDQSAKTSYADSATLIGGHAIYQLGDWKATALYARWDLAGDAAKAAKQNLQDGGYVELSYKPMEKLGLFARHSIWSKKAGEEANQTDFGVNYWPYPQIVFKADFQIMNEYAARDNDSDILTDATAINLGMGYHF